METTRLWLSFSEDLYVDVTYTTTAATFSPLTAISGPRLAKLFISICPSFRTL